MEQEALSADSRRVRFASINGLTRADLPLAGEVWRDDTCRAPWATRETMKIAALLIRYMTMPDPELLTLASIERHIQLSSGEVALALRLLNLYGAIEAYTVDRDEIKVAMHLSLMQRLRVLEARRRMSELMLHPAPGTFTDDHWHPADASTPGAAMDEPAVPDAEAESPATPAEPPQPPPARVATPAVRGAGERERAAFAGQGTPRAPLPARPAVTSAAGRARPAATTQLRAPPAR